MYKDPLKAKEYSRNHYLKNKEAKKEKSRLYRLTHPEKIKQATKNYINKNSSVIKEKKKIYNSLHPEKQRTRMERWKENNPQGYRKKALQRYGLSLEQYDSLLKSQNGVCAICSTNTPGGKGAFPVDHCHKTNKVRGLLCNNCNAGLGMLEESIDILQKAIKYLKNNG